LGLVTILLLHGSRRKKQAEMIDRFTRPIWRTAAIEHYAPHLRDPDVMRNTLL